MKLHREWLKDSQGNWGDMPRSSLWNFIPRQRGGGFFGSSPPGVKLLSANYTNTVANPGPTTILFTFPVTVISTIPTGKTWRLRSSAQVVPPAIAGTFNYQINLCGNALGATLPPVYTGAYSTAGFVSSTIELEAMLSNPNNGNYNYTIHIRHNARSNPAAQVTDLSITELSGAVAFSAQPLLIQAFVSGVSGSLTHQFTTLELLQ